MLMLAAGSGGVSGRSVSDESVSDESVNAAVTIGSGEAGVASAAADASAGASVTDPLAVAISALLAVTISAVANAIGWCVPATVASAARAGAKRSTIGAAPELNATSQRTEAGKATSRPNAAIAVNRGFMITASNRIGLHSQACDAGHLWSHDVHKQWRKPRILNFQKGCCLNATCCFRCTGDADALNCAGDSCTFLTWSRSSSSLNIWALRLAAVAAMTASRFSAKDKMRCSRELT
jgi:hypothetical protein